MYVIDGIAYAGEPEAIIKVCGVRALDNYKLWLRFSDGSIKIYDVNKMLNYPAFDRYITRRTIQKWYYRRYRKYSITE